MIGVRRRYNMYMYSTVPGYSCRAVRVPSRRLRSGARRQYRVRSSPTPRDGTVLYVYLYLSTYQYSTVGSYTGTAMGCSVFGLWTGTVYCGSWGGTYCNSYKCKALYGTELSRMLVKAVSANDWSADCMLLI